MEKRENFEIHINNTNGKHMPSKLSQESFVKRDLKNETSDSGALLHIIKGCLGAGILAMPFAFKHSGLWLGLVGSTVVGIIVTHTTAMLINCSQGLCEIFNKSNLSYADTAEYAFLYGFKGKLKNQAYKARYLVNFFLFITYYGLNTYYVLLISSTFKQVIDEYTDTAIDIRLYTLSLIILIYPASILRLMKFLVPFSAIANTILILALILIFREIFHNLPPLSSKPAVQHFDHWPMFIATVFLSMEGIGTVMPVENEMKNPKHLTNFPGLLYIGMFFVVLLNTSVGFFGYLKYGDESKGAISLNLPDDWFSAVVKISVALVILFTFGLQMTVSVKVIWDGMSLIFVQNENFYYYVVRSVLIFGTVLIATVLPSLGAVIGLIGSIGFAMLGIFCPALIELVYLSEDKINLTSWTTIKDIFLLILSAFCGVTGTYCSVLEIIVAEN